MSNRPSFESWVKLLSQMPQKINFTSTTKNNQGAQLFHITDCELVINGTYRHCYDVKRNKWNQTQKSYDVALHVHHVLNNNTHTIELLLYFNPGRDVMVCKEDLTVHLFRTPMWLMPFGETSVKPIMEVFYEEDGTVPVLFKAKWNLV